MAKYKSRINDKWIDDLEENIQKAVKQVIEDTAQKVMAKAKEKCPVRTGRLQESIEYRLRNKGKRAVVVTDALDTATNSVCYGRIVEFSPKINKPYMIPAMEECRDEFIDNVSEAIKNATK